MSDIVAIAGSPSHASKSAAVLEYIKCITEQHDLKTNIISVRDLSPDDLIYGRYDSPQIQDSRALVEQAHAVIIATPVYKAAYTGILKAFLDLLPQNALAGKPILPIATGGSIAHLLSIDYALKPVLSALGAQHILNGIYIVDSQIQHTHDQPLQLEADIDKRLQRSLYELIGTITTQNCDPLGQKVH